MVSDFIPSVKALGGGRIEVNGLFVLTPEDGEFYQEALNLICKDGEEVRLYRGPLCQERITIQRIVQTVGRIGQQVMGAIVGLARTVARACGFNPRWDATPVSRCGATRGAVCNDERPVALKAEWKKGTVARLAALHREVMLGAGHVAPPCVMDDEEEAEGLPPFEAMSRGPKGRAKSRLARATHANRRERNLAAARREGRKAKTAARRAARIEEDVVNTVLAQIEKYIDLH